MNKSKLAESIFLSREVREINKSDILTSFDMPKLLAIMQLWSELVLVLCRLANRHVRKCCSSGNNGVERTGATSRRVGGCPHD